MLDFQSSTSSQWNLKVLQGKGLKATSLQRTCPRFNLPLNNYFCLMRKKKPHKIVIIGVSLNHTRTKKWRNISINTAFVMQCLSPKMNCKHLKIATKTFGAILPLKDKQLQNFIQHTKLLCSTPILFTGKKPIKK